MAVAWNAAFSKTPAGSDDPKFGDDRIRELKTAVVERLEKEHLFDLAEAGSQPRQGLHAAGSAVCFYQADAPTQRNGVALGASDAGLVWIDSDAESSINIWDGTQWISLGDTAATPDTLVKRDAAGRAKVVAPSADDQVALLSTAKRMVLETLGYQADYQVFGTAGANTWTKPTGFNYVFILLIGASGGGGGGDASNNDNGSGGGGPALMILGRDVRLVSSIAFTLGAAGVGGVEDTNGTAGGTTTFGGFTLTGGGAGLSDAANRPGGAGGVVSGTDADYTVFVSLPGGEGGIGDDTNTEAGGGGAVNLDGADRAYSHTGVTYTLPHLLSNIFRSTVEGRFTFTGGAPARPAGVGSGSLEGLPTRGGGGGGGSSYDGGAANPYNGGNGHAGGAVFVAVQIPEA